MPRNLFSQLAHVELLTPAPEATAAFLADTIGLEEAHREGSSVWLRGWGEWLHSSVVVTEAPASGLGHIGWRAAGPGELEQAVAAVRDTEAVLGWIDGAVGHGPAFRFRDPEGHVNEVFWEVERYRAPEAMRSRFPNRPQRYLPRGAGARRIDHVTLGARDVPRLRGFYVDAFAFRHMESIHLDHDDTEIGAFVTTTPASHDLGFIADPTGSVGRLDHVAFWVDSEVELRRAADILVEDPQGVELGPERHAVGENFCVYAREPGGNRIELFTGPGYANHLPDWEPVRWKVSQSPGSYYGREIPQAFHRAGSPPVEGE